MSHYKEFYYTVDQIENDPVLLIPVVISAADAQASETFDFLKVLATKAAEDFYQMDGGKDDLSEWPINFYLYDEQQTYMGGLRIEARRVGNFSVFFEPVALEMEAA